MSAFEGPKIPTNGLVLSYDAANKKSYPGSGTTLYDLGPNKNNATLDGVMYNSERGGALYFDPANYSYGYLDFANPPAETIIVWARSYDTDNWGSYGWISSCRGENGHIIHPDNAWYMAFWIADSAGDFYYMGTAAPPDGSTDSSIPRMYSITTNGSNSHKGYINDSLVVNITTSITRTSSPASIPYWFGCDQIESRYGKGYIYNILRYNRELSADEIQKIYRTIRPKIERP